MVRSSPCLNLPSRRTVTPMIDFFPLLFAYIGPETILPLASAAAAVGGVFMLFWNSITRGVGWLLQKGKRKATAERRGA